jgi:uncharacterized membrane protein
MVMGAFHRWRSWESGTHGHATLVLEVECQSGHGHMILICLSLSLLQACFKVCLHLVLGVVLAK